MLPNYSQLIQATFMSTGNSVLWELHVAGNFGTGTEVETLVPEIEPRPILDTGNRATEQILLSLNPALNEGPPSKVSRAGTADLENHKSLESGLQGAVQVDVLLVKVASTYSVDNFICLKLHPSIASSICVQIQFCLSI